MKARLALAAGLSLAVGLAVGIPVGAAASADAGVKPTREPITVENAVDVEAAPPVRFVIAGDSITALDVDGVPRGDRSWVSSVIASGEAEVVGGYAVSGSMSWQVAERIGAYPESDALVILLGTNDVNNGLTPAATLASLDSIAATTAAPRVIVVALPPSDRHPAETAAHNAAIAEHATAVGWVHVDPWTPYRTVDGRWIAGAAYDELHPNGATQLAVGSAILAALTATR